MPQDVVGAKSINGLKKQLDKFLAEKFMERYKTQRCRYNLWLSVPLRHRLLGGCARMKYPSTVALLLHCSLKFLLQALVSSTGMRRDFYSRCYGNRQLLIKVREKN